MLGRGLGAGYEGLTRDGDLADEAELAELREDLGDDRSGDVRRGRVDLGERLGEAVPGVPVADLHRGDGLLERALLGGAELRELPEDLPGENLLHLLLDLHLVRHAPTPFCCP